MENENNELKKEIKNLNEEINKMKEIIENNKNINNNPGGGCFSGNGEVKLRNNSYKKIKELIKGDILENGAIVDCLIKIKVNKIIPVIELNNVYYSLKHPVIYNEKWTYPIDIKSPKFTYVDYWYNLVLKNGHSIKINDIEAVTLGHNGLHPYFGTNKVLNALKKYKEYADGKIIIKKALNIERDENGRICKYY